MSLMKPQLPNSKLKASMLMNLLLLVAILIELYLAYVYLYPNLNISDETIGTRDVVRVDLKSYEQTINLLNSLESYTPTPLNLPRSNPFQ